MNRFRYPRTHRTAPGALAALLIAVGTVGVPLAVTSATPAGAAPPATDTSGWSVAAPQLATIAGGGSGLAPWNTSQGDSTPGTTAYPQSDLLPTFVPGGPTTTLGGVTEPNVAVNSGSGSVPYASGVVGSPGPLENYCGAGANSAEDAGTPSRQPAGTVLPMSPYYFPHVVRNADGSMTGYFDWRPKDADEAIVVGRSTDDGKDWTYEGEALEQNRNYCPNADVNDDGQGHPQVLTIGGSTYLYTLQRAAGDNVDVPLLAHAISPTSSDPLTSVPAAEQVGLDADAFAAGADAVSHTAASTITVGATNSGDLEADGDPGSPDELVPGPVVDLTQTPTPTAASIITCTAVTATTLTGCTTPSGSTVNVAAGDLIEQVIATVKTAATIPTGPNNTGGSGGLAKLAVTPVDALSLSILNANAPNRIYVNGVAVYCSQANANPTTNIEDCTTGEGGPALTPAVGAPVTMDPVVPSTALATSGLVSPDGIVGVLPTYPGVPSGDTAVMYTEKVLGYYVAGVTTNSATTTYGGVVSGSPTSSAFSMNFNPSAAESMDLPATISAGSPVTLEMGDATKSSIIPVTCTGLGTTTAGSPGTAAVLTFSGCTVPSADAGDTLPVTAMIGTAGAATTAESTLALTGEGSTKSTAAAKLFGNNEDLEVLRVAYTNDGLHFSSAGLDNNGVISGQSNGDPSSFNPASPAGDNYSGSAYSDLSNPEQTVSPSNLNAYGASGTEDAMEMRWVGSTGTIITNPDGSIGLFLNGSFAADGDSDAFNQVFYSTSTDGEHWTTPVSVVSTDYTFSASVAQDQALTAGQDDPLGISAYYSGRAYNPTIVPNGDGTLTMLFSGYRTPGAIKVGATPIGTNTAAQYTPNAEDPLLYRNILVTTLTPESSDPAPTTTTVTAAPAAPSVGQPVTYTATVATSGPGDPTGTVAFSDGSTNLCAGSALTVSAPDTATCNVTYDGGGVTGAYSGDVDNEPSSSTLDFAPSAPTGVTATAGSDSALVSWTAPTATGGSAVSGYTVTAVGDSGNETCTSASTSCTVPGLTNGTSYTFTVTATNSVGTGPASAPSSAVVPTGSPDAPTGVTASPGAGQATVSWNPAGPEGSTVSGYTVTATDATTPANGGETCSYTVVVPEVDQCTVTGLTNGDSYTFTVTATNVDGTGPASAPSAAVVPSSVPDAPADVVATAGDGSATVSWAAAGDEGSTVTGYTVTDGQGDTCTGADPADQCTVTGLTNGDSYTFTVTATNADGTGPASAPSAAVIPSTVPDAPTGVTATAGDASATVSWTAPSDEGSAITGYTVTASPGGATCTTVDGSTTTCTVTGLTNGTAYTFTVTATNADGTGTPASPSAAVTPSTVPDVPTDVTAVAGNRSATVSWSAPSDEGSPITGYTVTSSGGQTCSTSGTTCLVTGLINGTSYTFTVTATSADGTGPASAASPAVTPSTVPDAPTGVAATAGDASATISWTAPGDEGSTITGYTVTASNSNPPKTCTTTGATTCSITGLANGANYTFTVRATNADGSGAASAPSAIVVPTSNTAVITSADSDTVALGKSLDFTVTASGTPAATISASGLPAGLRLVAGRNGKASLKGAPTAGAGTYAFTLSADNGTGPGDDQSFTLVVFGITSSASATFTVGTHGSFAITTAPALAGTTIRATPSSKLAGLTVTSGGDGTATLEGTPTTGDRSGTVTVKATDGSLSVTQKLHVTIDG
jgi:titin